MQICFLSHLEQHVDGFTNEWQANGAGWEGQVASWVSGAIHIVTPQRVGKHEQQHWYKIRQYDFNDGATSNHVLKTARKTIR